MTTTFEPCIRPLSMGCRIPVLPTAYSDSLSYYEQLCKMLCALNGVINYINGLDEKYSDFTDDVITALKEMYAELLAIIKDVQAGVIAPIFDETYGIEPQPLEDVLAHIYRDTRYYALTCVEFENAGLTCEKFESLGLTARAFDLYDWSIYGVTPYISNGASAVDPTEGITLDTAYLTFVALNERS